MEHGRPSESLPPAIEQRLAALETLVREQQATITHQRAIIAEQQTTMAVYEEQLSRATEQVKLLKKALFSPRRERYAPSPDQTLLFPAESLSAETEESDDSERETEDDEPPAAATRPAQRRQRRIMFPQFLPRKRREYPLPEAERPCGCCGQERTVIRQSVTEQLEIEPPRAYVVEHVRLTYACPQCRDGQQVVTTAKPPQPIEKSPFGASALALLAVNKFARHLPLYRQQEILRGPVGRWFSRGLLSRLLAGTAEALLPLYERIRIEVLLSFVLAADEIPVPVLGLKPQRAALGYLWSFGGDALHPLVYYHFHPSRNRDGPAKMLSEYRGYLLTDGYGVYESLVAESQGRLVPVSCWAHARRGFDEARYTTTHPLLHEMLAGIQQIYDVEDRAADWSADARRQLRTAESAPILAGLRKQLVEARGDLRPKSKLAEAVNYALARWDALQRFLEDGRIPLDNNHLERLLRPVAVGRKNYLFFGSQNGGRTAAVLYSVMQSARWHCVDLLPYLTDVLRRLPALSPDDRDGITLLLPHHWATTHPEHVLTERVQESAAATRRRRARRAARRMAAAG